MSRTIDVADASNGTHEKKTEMELGTPRPKTISAKMLREMEGLPAGSLSTTRSCSMLLLG